MGATVTEHFHGVNGIETIGVKVSPGADLLQKFGIGRTDGVDSRVPAFGGTLRVTLDKGNFQPRFAQGAGQGQPRKAAAHDDYIKPHRACSGESRLCPDAVRFYK